MNAVPLSSRLSPIWYTHRQICERFDYLILVLPHVKNVKEPICKRYCGDNSRNENKTETRQARSSRFFGQSKDSLWQKRFD